MSEGLKQLVKLKKLSAKSAMDRLFAKADLNKEAGLVKQSKTWNWLNKKVAKG